MQVGATHTRDTFQGRGSHRAISLALLRGEEVEETSGEGRWKDLAEQQQCSRCSEQVHHAPVRISSPRGQCGGGAGEWAGGGEAESGEGETRSDVP